VERHTTIRLSEICFGYTWHSARRHAGGSGSAAPTAADVVASIQRGRETATSLSNVGGAATDTQLTSRALAEMSEEQFAELFNELQTRGDRAKLMQLFGH
jgi:hypothetical protein